MAPTPTKVAAKPAAAKPKTAKGDLKKRPRKRNSELGNGIVRFSKTKMFHKKAVYRFIGKKTPKTVKPKKRVSIIKKIGGEKNGGTRVVFLKKRKAFYPTQDKMPKTSYKKCFSKHVRNTRSILEPGRILILLAGRHKGKRVVLVKVLPSGLLLVSGPFRYNGCPLRRISQRYVIGTSAKLDISSVTVPEHLNDLYFKKNKKSSKRSVKRKEGEDIFSAKKEKYAASEERKADQKTVDLALLKVIRKNPDRKVLKQYFKSMFGLRSSQYPHRMKF
ncbi:ribosomal protein L6 [Arctopsyche grandis]|uniref:ribosomal protein L6 n=1 Tax=Arctopsyche grandis TaxID=121162 RepID=UPI00406D88E7